MAVPDRSCLGVLEPLTALTLSKPGRQIFNPETFHGTGDGNAALARSHLQVPSRTESC